MCPGNNFYNERHKKSTAITNINEQTRHLKRTSHSKSTREADQQKITIITWTNEKEHQEPTRTPSQQDTIIQGKVSLQLASHEQ
jgi:hypothetical protein